MKGQSRRQIIRRRLIFFSFLLFPFTVFYFSPVLVFSAASSGVVADKKVKNGWARYLKYFIFVPWLTVVMILFVGGGIHKVDPMYLASGSMPLRMVQGYVAYFMVVVLIVLMSLIMGTWTFCHSLCWMAPFMVAGTKLKDRLGYPSLGLRAHPEQCTGCEQCSRKCPMALDVEAMVRSGIPRNSECILCGVCADACGPGAVRLEVSRGQ